MTIHVAYPLRFDDTGRTATSDRDRHVREMIEQVLFTAPGERVNRPSFGCGLLQLVFEPNSTELAATAQYLVQSALEQWLGDAISVDDVAVRVEDATLEVTVVYTILESRRQHVDRFARRGSV